MSTAGTHISATLTIIKVRLYKFLVKFNLKYIFIVICDIVILFEGSDVGIYLSPGFPNNDKIKEFIRKF